MFAPDTMIAMGDREGTCVPIASLAALSLKDGFTSKKVPEHREQYFHDRGLVQVAGTEASTIETDAAGYEIPVRMVVGGERALFVKTKNGGKDSHYLYENANILREAQIVAPLKVSDGECVELSTSNGWTLVCHPRTKLCLRGGGYVYAEEVDRYAVLDTYAGRDTIKTIGHDCTPAVTRKTGQLVSINLWTAHCLLANGIWVLTD